MYYWLGRLSQSEETFLKIKPIVEQHGTPAQRASFFRSVANHSIRRDRFYFSSDAISNQRAALEAYQQAGIHEYIPSSKFQYGFALLFSDELELAEEELLSALQLAEQRGDLSLQARCLTYLTILYRKKGQLEIVETYATKSLSIANEARMPEYAGAAMANQAWIAWRRGDYQIARDYSRAALSNWEQSPSIQSFVFPYYWTAVWPLIGVALLDNQFAGVFKCIKTLINPNYARIPDELEASLNEANAAWDSGDVKLAGEVLRRAMTQAENYQYI